MLQKYPQSFFQNFNNKAKLKRFRHRLTAWYLLNRIGKNTDKGLYFFLKYLAKYADIKKSLNSSFVEMKDRVEKIYDINIDTQSIVLKNELINGCKICKNCAKRSKSIFCSIKCANLYHSKDTEFKNKLSLGMKNYYKNADNNKLNDRHNKIKLTIKKMYECMTPEEIKKQCVNNNISYTAYSNFSEKFHGLSLNCTEDFFYNNKHIPIICDCGNHFIGNKSTAFYPICRVCYPTKKHKTQDEISEFIRKYSDIYTDSRTIIPPLELDIYSKKYKFAIEYDGLIWHSFGKSSSKLFNNFKLESKNKHKHLKKTELCEDKGIQLYHIFENEWLDATKNKIWRSVIFSKLNNTDRLYARKCVVKELNSKETNVFLENNHLQGSCVSSINIGLYYNDKLVQIMTFSKSRFSKKYQYELIRMCSILNTTVVGGASKLLKYFERNYNPESLVSYANRRWSEGNVYEQLGFTFSHNSSPNYFYFNKSNILWSRNKFQKHKLSRILDKYDLNKTETENMFMNNYRRIWDCGNKVYFKYY